MRLWRCFLFRITVGTCQQARICTIQAPLLRAPANGCVHVGSMVCTWDRRSALACFLTLMHCRAHCVYPPVSCPADGLCGVVLERPGAVPRLLRAAAVGAASEGVLAALARRAAEGRRAGDAMTADLRVAVELVGAGRGGSMVQGHGWLEASCDEGTGTHEM